VRSKTVFGHGIHGRTRKEWRKTTETETPDDQIEAGLSPVCFIINPATESIVFHPLSLRERVRERGYQ
jgi:hypothetical protein